MTTITAANDVRIAARSRATAKGSLTRSRAIRDRCRECAGDSYRDVTECDVTACPLWRFRLGREVRVAPGSRYTRAKAIRLHCVECMGGQAYLVPQCVSPLCALFGFRNWGTVHDRR